MIWILLGETELFAVHVSMCSGFFSTNGQHLVIPIDDGQATSRCRTMTPR